MNRKILITSVATILLVTSLVSSCGKKDESSQEGDVSSIPETTVGQVETSSEPTPTGEYDNNGYFLWSVDGITTSDLNIEVTNVMDLVLEFSDDFEVPENFHYVVECNGKIVDGDGTAYSRRRVCAVAHYGVKANDLGYVPAGSYSIIFYDGDSIIATHSATVNYDEESARPLPMEVVPGEDFAAIQLYEDSQCLNAIDEPKAGMTGFYITCFTATVHEEYTLTGKLTHKGKVINVETVVSTDFPLGDLIFENEDGSPMESGIYKLEIKGYGNKVFATVQFYLE